jgi:3-oxoacyl-[acyl-carrier protein] reductase
MNGSDRPTTPRIAIVVGGARGIGGASAELLARDGFSVIVADVGDASGVVARITSEGHVARSIPLDLSDPDSFAGFFAQIEGAVGAVVITAALLGPLVPLVDYRREDWDRVVAVNLTGTFFFGQHAAKRIVADGGGRLIFFMSGAGRYPGKTTIIPYIATKGAIPALVFSFTSAFKGTGLLVAAVDPGRTETPMIMGPVYKVPEEGITPDLPLGRLLDPMEVAEIVRYLCSPAANGVTNAIWGVSTRP